MKNLRFRHNQGKYENKEAAPAQEGGPGGPWPPRNFQDQVNKLHLAPPEFWRLSWFFDSGPLGIEILMQALYSYSLVLSFKIFDSVVIIKSFFDYFRIHHLRFQIHYFDFSFFIDGAWGIYDRWIPYFITSNLTFVDAITLYWIFPFLSSKYNSNDIRVEEKFLRVSFIR